MRNPEAILFHVGVNDLGNGADPKLLSDRLVSLATNAAEKFRCRTYISDITPLKGYMHEVEKVNNFIHASLMNNTKVSSIAHPNLTTNQLIDDRHLVIRGPPNFPTAREMLVDDLYKATTGRHMKLQELQNTFKNRSNQYQHGRK